MSKIISIDIDGTLYNKKHVKKELGLIDREKSKGSLISGLGMRLIFKLISKGNIILINSSSPDGKNVQKFLKDIEYFYKESLKSDSGLNEDLIRKSLSNLYFSTYKGSRLYNLSINNNYEIKTNLVDEKKIKSKDIERLIKKVNKKFPNALEIKYLLMNGPKREMVENSNENKDANAVMLICGENVEIKNIQDYILNTTDYDEIISPEDNCIFIGSKIGKEQAIINLAKMKNIAQEDLYHIGDSQEDVMNSIHNLLIKNDKVKNIELEKEEFVEKALYKLEKEKNL